MQFFLYEVVARIVAIYLFVDCSRQLWDGLVERKITYVFGSSDWVTWLLDWSPRPRWVAHRDTTPIRYWMIVGSVVFTLAGCIVIAIFGWFHPNT